MQIVGYINNPGIGLASNDSGGELDPHGADLQGNPLGGVAYTNISVFGGASGTYTQVQNWNLSVLFFFVNSDLSIT